MLFTLNVLLALAWAGITGSFTPLNLFFGFVLAILALWIIRRDVGSVGYFSKAVRIIALILLFIKELFLSAWKVVTLVLSPNMDVKPGIFAFPLSVKSDIEITILANMITLTPGTLSVDVSDDKSTLYVHAIDASDPDALRADIANGFEKRIMKAFRS